MNDCLEGLAQDYQFVKFCKVRSLEISLTEKFVRIFILVISLQLNEAWFYFREKSDALHC